MERDTLQPINQQTSSNNSNDWIKIGFSLLFMAAVLTYTSMTNGNVSHGIFLAVAAVFGAYMAMNIGANDVANNVGPAVGSKALTLGGAIAVAAIFEAAGALIAGGDVVKTIKKGIIDISAFGGNADPFIWAMMAALLAAALWLNFATAVKAPVSTTHSIVGGVMGAGIAAAGFSIVSWETMGTIAASWVISPIMGGAIAALFLFAIKKTIVFQEDRVEAARKWVPVFVALMTWAFVTYLTLKGLKKIWPTIVHFVNEMMFFTLPVTDSPTFFTASMFGLILAGAVFLWMVKRINTSAHTLENSRESVNRLFTIPLIFAAALLSFAHGANDVANAIGPLAAINDAVISGGISAKAGIPLWVMAVGALGISLGLALYGPKLIRTVGSEITELDQMRAFSIAMAAAITVIIASQLGLPVSSTHIALGGVFGVGFLREWLHMSSLNKVIDNETTIIKDEKSLLHTLKQKFEALESKEAKTKDDYERILELYQMIEEEETELKKAAHIVQKAQKVKYVKRDAVKKIVAAWIITVPAAAMLSALLFFTIKGIML